MHKNVFLLFVFISLSAKSQSVKVSSDKDVDFNTYSTFRIDKGEIVTLADQPLDDEKIDKVLQQSIAQHLREKGYKEIEDTSADLVITYIGQVLSRIDTETIGPLGQQPASTASEVDRSRNWARETSQGELIVSVTDNASKKIVWKSTSSLENVSLENERTLIGIVAKSFKKFPKKK